MQEEVENRTLTLAVSGSKFSGQMLKTAIGKYLAHRTEAKRQKARDGPVTPRGRQTVKQLIGQGQGVSSIEANDPSLRDFERIARKYSVDYAIKRDRAADPPRFLIFFKARDEAAITAAFTEFSANKVRKASRPSVLQKLSELSAKIKSPVKAKEKHKELER